MSERKFKPGDRLLWTGSEYGFVGPSVNLPEEFAVIQDRHGTVRTARWENLRPAPRTPKAIGADTADAFYSERGVGAMTRRAESALLAAHIARAIEADREEGR